MNNYPLLSQPRIDPLSGLPLRADVLDFLLPGGRDSELDRFLGGLGRASSMNSPFRQRSMCSFSSALEVSGSRALLHTGQTGPPSRGLGSISILGGLLGPSASDPSGDLSSVEGLCCLDAESCRG